MELAHGLTLVERSTLLLNFLRRDPRSGCAQLDEWQIKEWVRGVVHKCLGQDVAQKDLLRRPGGSGSCWQLLLWNPDAQRVQQRLIPLLEGAELNVSGVRLQCSVTSETAASLDDPRGSRTLAIKGLPRRWVVDSRVSGQASPQVAREIFCKFGNVRNVEIVGDGDEGQLQCTIWIQYEHSSDLLRALQALGGRAMQKEGSSLKANYTLQWDRDDYFDENNVRKRRFEREHAQKLANDARIAEAHKVALEERRAEQERLARAALQAQREEEAERLKEEQEAAERMRQLQLEEQRRRDEEALREQQIQMEAKLREEEERRQMEEEARLKVEKINEEIREATRKLLEEQEQRKKADEQRNHDEGILDSKLQKHEGDIDSSMSEGGRWELYLDEECTPWPAMEVHLSRSSKRLSSKIVGKLQAQWT